MTAAAPNFDRYRRQIRFAPLGEAGQQRLAAASVLVVGCGALGSVAADLLVRAGVVSRGIATFLQNAVMARVNLLVVGPRDAGTTRVLSALLAQARSEAPMVVVEAHDGLSELVHNAAVLRDWSAGQLQRALVAATRLPSARLAAELSDSAVVTSVLEAARLGADGIIAVAHAGSARSALAQISAMAAQSGEPLRAARESVAASFELVLEIGRLRD